MMDDAALTQLLDAAFAFACNKRVSDFVDVDKLLAAADAAAEPSRIARFVSRFAAPARARILERLRASSLPLGVWLPDPVRDAIAALLGQPRRSRARSSTTWSPTSTCAIKRAPCCKRRCKASFTKPSR